MTNYYYWSSFLANASMECFNRYSHINALLIYRPTTILPALSSKFRSSARNVIHSCTKTRCKNDKTGVCEIESNSFRDLIRRYSLSQAKSIFLVKSIIYTLYIVPLFHGTHKDDTLCLRFFLFAL